MNQSSLTTLVVPVSTVSRSDRWLVSQRLQELSISSYCAADGYLHVEITHLIDIAQLRSVVQQLTATRADLLNWLEDCWSVRDSSPN